MKEKGVEWVPMEKGYAEADFVTVHVPLKADTRGMIDAAAFAKMKPGAIFLNLSRGPVVEQAALIAALESGHLAGAGLDVFEAEPVLADDPVTRAPNLVLSPHYAGDTLAARNRASSTIARSVLDALNGQAIDGLVNPAVLERSNCRLANMPGGAGKRFRRPVESASSLRHDGTVSGRNGSFQA
jgi:phosphoglycerate dehydrogenase-like enzyme